MQQAGPSKPQCCRNVGLIILLIVPNRRLTSRGVLGERRDVNPLICDSLRFKRPYMENANTNPETDVSRLANFQTSLTTTTQTMIKLAIKCWTHLSFCVDTAMKTFARTATLTIVLCVSHVLAATASAQDASTDKSLPSEKWVVLIGVDQYAYATPLKFAVADQQSLRDELVQSGLDSRQVTLLRDKSEDTKYLPSKSNIEYQIKAACEMAERGDMVLIVFSGHGLHIAKKSYVCPADGRLDDTATMVALDWIYDQLKASKADLKMVIVDACRGVDPYKSGRRSGSAPDRKEEIRAFISSTDRLPDGLIVLQSCSEGEEANEDPTLGHGVFTHFLLEGLKGKADRDRNGHVTLGELMLFSNRETKLHVHDKFGAIQRPKVSGNYTLDAQDFEIVSLSAAKVSDRVARMNPADSPKRPVSPGDNEQEITNSIGMKLTLIPAGEFMMGSPEDEADRSDDEGPQHKVRITKPFYMGVTEVTQGQWFSVMGTKPWSGKEYVEKGNDNPAVYVGWEDVVAYCEKLSSTENKLYRLPTEAEWEYACRGGTDTAYSFGSSTESLKDYAWFDENAWNTDEKYAHVVGTKKPNAFGLYDMHGNVWEWCADLYDSEAYKKRSSGIEDPIVDTGSGSSRVLRGGSWFRHATFVRSSLRYYSTPDNRFNSNGFRVVAE